MAATRNDRQEAGNDHKDVETGDFKHRLMARQDNSRHLPHSNDINETTVTLLDGHPVTAGSRAHSGDRPADPLTLPVVAATTSTDHDWSNMSPVDTDNDRSSVKSDESRPSSGIIPARLSAIDVRQWSNHNIQDDLRQNSDVNKHTAAQELEPMESFRIEGGGENTKIPDNEEYSMSIDGGADEFNDITANATETPLSVVNPNETTVNAEDRSDDNEKRQQAESMHWDSHTQTPTQHDGIITSQLNDDIHGDLATVTENNQTSAEILFDTQVEAQRGVEVKTSVEPGENDSGVNVEDVHNSEPNTEEQDDTVHETPAAISTSAVASTNDELSSPPAQLNVEQQQSDTDRLSVRKSPRYTDSRKLSNSNLDAADPRQQLLRQSAEGLVRNTDQNKPRLLALAQRGEWSVLDQILRAMERSSFYEVNLADEV